MWRRLPALIRKELQALLRDPNGRRLLILPVILQIVLFPAAATLDVRNAGIAVLNQDSGAQSSELIQRLGAAQAFPDMILLRDPADIEHVIDRQAVLLVVQIPPDFSRDVLAGRDASLQVIIDARRSNSAQIATGYVQSIVGQFQAEQGGAANAQSSAPTDIQLRNWYNPALESRWFVVPSLVAIITTIGCLIVTALSVAREREQGTLDQVLVSPLSPAMIMVGKAVPALMVATVQATIVVIAGLLIYQLPFTGSVFVLYGAILAYGLALAGFGLFISALCATQQQAFLGSFMFMVPAILLSGFISPIENMPVVLQWISWIDPLRHFIVIVKGVFLKEFGPVQAAAHVWPLLMIALLTLSSAYILFRRRTA